MLKRFNDLSFVIGLFFLLVSLILLAHIILTQEKTGKLNLYTGIVFFIFGVLMIFGNSRKNKNAS